ncbi:hypothetical protein Ciccas_008446, partial [Cichlidogyrus casuarinus]
LSEAMFWQPRLFQLPPQQDEGVTQTLVDRMEKRQLYKCLDQLYLCQNEQGLSSQLACMLPRQSLLFCPADKLSLSEELQQQAKQAVAQTGVSVQLLHLVVRLFKSSSTKHDPVLVYYEVDGDSFAQTVPLEKTFICLLFYTGQQPLPHPLAQASKDAFRKWAREYFTN